jgi:hypothetical protein
MTNKEIVETLGLTRDEMKALLERARAFYDSLDSLQKNVFQEILQTTELATSKLDETSAVELELFLEKYAQGKTLPGCYCRNNNCDEEPSE